MYECIIDWGAVGRLKALKWSSDVCTINEFIVHVLVKGHFTPTVSKLFIFFKQISTLLGSFSAVDLCKISE